MSGALQVLIKHYGFGPMFGGEIAVLNFPPFTRKEKRKTRISAGSNLKKTKPNLRPDTFISDGGHV